MNGNNATYYRFRVRFSRRYPASRLTHLEHINTVRQLVTSLRSDFVPLGLKRPDVPKVSFGPALPAGYESTSEYADIYFKRYVASVALFKKLSGLVAQGYSVVEFKRIPYHFPSVESLVNVAEYEIRGSFEISQENIDDFLARPEILIKKVKASGKTSVINAKPLILSMKKVSAGCMVIFLGFGPGKHLKPDLVINEFSNAGNLKILRRQLYWKNLRGELVSP
jgi:radical SAM-linked protein